MKKSLLKRIIELTGFAIIGLVFFIWFLGNQQNNNGLQLMNSSNVLRSQVTESSTVQNYSNDKYDGEDIVIRSEDYSGSASTYKQPRSVARNVDYVPVRPEVATKRSKSDYTRRQEAGAAVRSWKGAHRDESFAWLCYERFAEDVVDLAEEKGLYPEVLMARIVAYSYEYVTNPKSRMADNNFTGMKKPKGEDRARFRNPLESLKAYAVVNAGEVNHLSAEGALAKHDRAWTMRKIIEQYEFISNLSATNGKNYKGKVGTANRISKEEIYKHEYAGEAMKMTSSVERKVKKRRAKEAGYENWDSYLESLPEGKRVQQEDNVKAVTAAVSKKKSFNLGRRVDAKRN